MKKLLGTIALGISTLAFACPNPAEFNKILHNGIKNPNLKVEKIEPAPIKGLCQAVTDFNGEKIILYTDETGRYLLFGARGLVFIFDLQTQENLTQKTLEEINKLSKNQVKELDKYVAFTYGNKGKVVYLFTDPECPFCQMLEPTLKKLADEGLIQVKVILFPLPFHAHAKEKAVAIVCKKLGWKALKRDYWSEERMKKLSEWQCKTGEELVKESQEIGRKYGIKGTPTMITEEGRKISGALPEAQLKRELGLEENKKNR